MIFNTHTFFKAMTAFFLCQVLSVHATLLVSPTKVMIKDRVRSTQLILMNTSNKAVTYRLSWVQKTVSESGKYELLTEEQVKSFPIASSMIRFSPRQVKLKPGGRQVVKISVRRPKDLAVGEYRSHLKLAAVPDEKETASSGQMSIKANILFSYVLPVVVRQGKASSKVSINEVSLLKATKEKTKASLKVSLVNKTPYSTTGNLIADLMGADGTEKIVARLHDFTFYPDKNKTQANLIWFEDCTKGCSGTLRVAFEGIKEKLGTIFAEYEMEIDTYFP